MGLIDKLENHYFIKLVFRLGFLVFSYKTICMLRKNFYRLGQLQQQLKNPSQINIEFLRKQFPVSKQSSQSLLKYQVVAGIARQEDEQFLKASGNHSPKLLAMNEFFLKKRRVPYFSIVDLYSDFNTKNDKIYIHPSSFTNIHSSVTDLFSYQEQQKLTKWQFLKHFKNLFSLRINYSGVAFGSPIYLIGDFILNQQNGIIRCYRTYEIGSQKSIMNVLRKKRVALLFALACAYIATISAIIGLIRLHRYPKQTGQKVPLQQAVISKGNESFKCEKCKNNLIDLIFLPCGHFNFCQECGITVDICPNCRTEVQETVRIYKS